MAKTASMALVVCGGAPTWANPLQGKAQDNKSDGARDYRCTKCGVTTHPRAKVATAA